MFHGPIEAAHDVVASARPSAAATLLGALLLAAVLPVLAVRLFAWALGRTLMKPVKLAALCGECVLEARRAR